MVKIKTVCIVSGTAINMMFKFALGCQRFNFPEGMIDSRFAVPHTKYSYSRCINDHTIIRQQNQFTMGRGMSDLIIISQTVTAPYLNFPETSASFSPFEVAMRYSPFFCDTIRPTVSSGYIDANTKILSFKPYCFISVIIFYSP